MSVCKDSGAIACPSCRAKLEKMPQRKTKCKACGEYIFVKSTPDNRENRLMTQSQADAAERAWANRLASDRDSAIRSNPKLVYQQLLQGMTVDLARYAAQGFRSVQVIGASDRTCSVCRALAGQTLLVSRHAEDILRTDCERFNDGLYHCSLSVSPAIKDAIGNVRFDRSS